MLSVGKHLVRQIKMAPMIKHISFNLASYYNFIYTGWKSIMEVNCLHLCLSIWSLFRISVYIRQDVSMWTVPSCFPGRVAVTWLETWSNVNVSLLDKFLCKKIHILHALIYTTYMPYRTIIDVSLLDIAVVICPLFCTVTCSWLLSEDFSYLSRAQRDSCQSDPRHTERTLQNGRKFHFEQLPTTATAQKMHLKPGHEPVT